MYRLQFGKISAELQFDVQLALSAVYRCGAIYVAILIAGICPTTFQGIPNPSKYIGPKYESEEIIETYSLFLNVVDKNKAITFDSKYLKQPSKNGPSSTFEITCELNSIAKEN
nr:hypothetical protein [Entomoplasma sp. MP1]